MATTTTYTIGGGLIYDGKKAVTVPRSYTPTVLDVSTLAGQTYEQVSGKTTKTVTIKGGAITDINASDLRTPLTVIGRTGTASDGKDDKAVSVTLGGSKSAGGLITGGGKGDKFFGGAGSDTFGLGGGDQVGADPKKTASDLLYGSNDVITINAAFKDLTFTDAAAKQTVTITDASKNKYTIYKQSVDTQLNIVTNDGDTKTPNLVSHTYGTDGTHSMLDAKGTNVTILSDTDSDNVIEVKNIAAGAKIIDATKVTATGGVYLTGNGAANNISIGSTGGTLSGGANYDPVKKTYKTTADNLYGTTVENADVVFYADANAGADNIYNYKNGDTIKLVLPNGTSSLKLTDAKVLKDGGAGKDVVLTYDSKNKVTIKNHGDVPIKLEYVNSSGTSVGSATYGVDFSNVGGSTATAGFNAKRTAITLGGTASGTVGIQGWSNVGYTGNASDTALFYAPKFNEIDASNATATGGLVLKAHDTMASVLRGAAAGTTTMYGGKGADQFYGGDGHDVIVFDVSKTGTVKGAENIGKNVVNDIEAGDFIMLKGYNSTVHTAVQVDSKGAIYLTGDKNEQKLNSITVKTFKPGKNNPVEQPVVVIDEKGEILAVNSYSGAPAPIGATVSSKNGFVTDANFNGAYQSDAYVVGATVNVSMGALVDNVNTQLTLGAGEVTIDAADYGGALKAIDARAINSTVTSLYIKGNEATKNTIYVPTLASDETSSTYHYVTIEGGTGADTFNRSTDATAVHTTYFFDATDYGVKADKTGEFKKGTGFGKDVISAYVEGEHDQIVFALPTSASIKDDTMFADFMESRISEKNSDVIVTFDKSNTITIKDGATKAISFADESGEYSYEYGYTLPEGYEYSKKHDAINAVANSDDYTQFDDGGETVDNMLNLRTGHYYAGVKTVSLAASTNDVYVYGSTIANEIYAPSIIDSVGGGSTLFGGSVLGLTTGEGSKAKPVKATADKLYGNTGSDTFIYMEGEGADVIGNTKSGNTHTLFHENDRLVLASNNGSALKRDNVTITDKNNVLTITLGTTKDKFTVNKLDSTTTVAIDLVSSIGADGTYNVAGNSFTYGMNDADFRGSLDLKKGSLVISDGGTAHTLANDTDTATLAAAELRNVASGIKNINVTAGSETAVSISGDLRNGNALTINMGLGGGTVEGGAKVKIGTKASTLTSSGYEETFTGFKDSVILDTAATKGTTFVVSSTGGADQITNYDASRGDLIYFKDPIDKVTVVRSSKGIQFSYDGKNSVLINAKNPGPDFDVNIYGTYSSGTSTVELNGKYYGWSDKSSKLVDFNKNVRDTAWTRSGETFIYDGTDADYTITSGSLKDANNDYVPDGVEIVNATSKLSLSNVKNYINPLVTDFHVAGTDLDTNTKVTINGVNYSLQEADGNTLNGFELTAGGFVKTGSDQVVYYGVDSNKLNENALFTLTGAFEDKGGQMESVVNGTTTTEAEITTGYLDKFTYTAASNQISIGTDSDTAKPLSAHIVLADDTSFDDYNLKIGSNEYKLYDGDGDKSNGYEFLRTDLATAAKWTLLTGDDDETGEQANGTGVWKFDDGITANNNTGAVNLKFLVSADDSLKPDAKGLPDGVTVTTSTTLTTVTFDNDFALAGNGFAKTGKDDFIYYGSLAAGNNLTVVDYKTYDVGGGNQFTLSGLVDDWDIKSDFGNFKYTDDTNKLEITGSTSTKIADFVYNKAHVTFSDDVLDTRGAGAAWDQNINITFVANNSETYSFKLYDGDGNAENGYEMLRTDLAATNNWTLLTGANDDDRVIDDDGYAIQANGTGFWKYNNTGTNGYGFIVSSEAGVKHAIDGTPIGISVSGGDNKALTISIDSTTGIGASHLLFDSTAKFGSETGAVHIAGLAIGTGFTIGDDGDTYQLADLDRDSSNGYELRKIDPASGWTVSDGAWTFDNKTIAWSDRNGNYTVADSIQAVQFTIDSDASLHADDDGYPIGVTVEADRDSKGKTLGTVEYITFSTETLADHVTFSTLPTGDIDATSHIIGFSSGTSTVPTFTMADEKEYYLVDLDGNDEDYEFVAKNNNWLRTKAGWSYFADSSTMKFDGTADIKIVATDDAVGTVRSALDGSPRGISITATADTSDTYITISSSTGVISTDKKDSAGFESVALTAAQLSFGTTTKVNDTHGLHILTADGTKEFEIGDTVSVSRQGESTATAGIYELANLDRDATNGFELISANKGNWQFNSGKDSGTIKTDVLGSWTYNSDTSATAAESDTLVGTMSYKQFTFNISEAASLLGENDTLGIPKGVTLTLGTAAVPGATIAATAEATATGLNLAHFQFNSVVAGATFLSDTGLHFVGFKEGDQLTVDFGTVQSGATTTSTKVYRLAELSGKSDDGLELLYTANPQYWSVTADSVSGARTWTYSNNLTGIDYLTISSDANLNSAADGGTPQGITIAGDKGIATISVDSLAADGTANGVSLKAADFAFTVSGAQQLGSGGTLHLVGFDTGTTLSVNGETYELANMDTLTTDYELLKKDADWQYYSQNIVIVDVDNTVQPGAGTWVYTDPGTVQYTIELTSDAGVVSTAKHIAPADENGRPVGISVDSDTSSVTLTKSALNINTYIGSNTTAANLNGNIIFSSNTPTGKNGLHVLGVDSDATITVGENTFYFAQLDGDSDNGFEFTPWNDNWHRTTDGWSYTDSTTNFNIAMSIASIIDPVETVGANSGNDSLIGSPVNVTITSSTPSAENATSDTFTFTGFDSLSSLVSFDSIVAGAGGLHIVGLGLNDEFTVSDTTYVLKELSGSSVGGYEFLAKDANWTLSNSGANDAVRTWSYSGANGLTFAVSTDSVVTNGLAEIAGNTGRPIGASVVTAWADAASSTAASQTITFGATDTGTATNEGDTHKIVGLNMLVGSTLAADDLTKVHIAGFADASVVNGSSYAYTTDTGKMFTIGGAQYYLAELDGNTDNGYELVKNDANWHRYADGWYYNDSATKLYFQVASDTAKAGSLLGAEKADTIYSGKPVGVDVEVSKKGVNTITIDTGATLNLVFSTSTSVENTHITYGTSNATLNPNTATALYAATGTPTFKFQYFSANGTISADGAATVPAAEGQTAPVYGSDTTYYLADTDGDTLTQEFVRADAHWTRYDNGWLYRDDADSTTFSFFVTSTAPTLNADGTPYGISVDSVTRVVSFDTDTNQWGTGASAAAKAGKITPHLVFFNDNKIGAYSDTTNGVSTHISIEGYADNASKELLVRYFNKDTSTSIAEIKALTDDSTVIGSGQSSVTANWYRLQNADANTVTGLELTYNGWASTSVGSAAAYLYNDGWYDRTNNDAKKNYTSFILSGDAFSTVAGDDNAPNVKGFLSATPNVITFDITGTDSSTTVNDFRVGSFKVFGSGTTSVGLFVDGASSVVAYDAEGDKVTFTLRNVVKDTTDDGSLELTNQGWYKVGVASSKDHMIFTDTSIGFTLSSATNGELDANNNLLPDVLENDSKKATFNIVGTTMNLSLKSDDSLRFTFASADAAVATDSMVVSVYNSDTNKYVSGYTFASVGSAVAYSIKAVEAEPSNPQLSANDAWTNTGYDIDDLLGGVTGSNDAVSELDDIIDVKPLAIESAATTFDPDAAFTEVGTDKTIRSLTYGARHKARK